MPHFNRRNLVKLAGSFPALGMGQAKAAAAQYVVVIEPGSDVTGAAPVGWALEELRKALGEYCNEHIVELRLRIALVA